MSYSSTKFTPKFTPCWWCKTNKEMEVSEDSLYGSSHNGNGITFIFSGEKVSKISLTGGSTFEISNPKKTIPEALLEMRNQAEKIYQDKKLSEKDEFNF